MFISQTPQIITEVRTWVETFVVDLRLCPFAKRELDNDRVRFTVSTADTVETLISDLADEIELLENDDSIETTLLIHPNVLQDFYAYNQYLDIAEGLLEQMGMTGVYQIASFHPDYQFAGTQADDAENFTNRSPYPMLHLIREASLERAIASYPDLDKVPENNIRILNSMGKQKLQILFRSYLKQQENVV